RRIRIYGKQQISIPSVVCCLNGLQSYLCEAMTAYEDADNYSARLSHSLRFRSRGVGDQPNAVTHTAPRSDRELKTAAPAATAQLGRRLASVETGHHTVVDRLRLIAEQLDGYIPRQPEVLQRQDTDARQQILRMREDLDAVQGFLPDQLRTLRNQCQTFGRQIQTTEQRFKEMKQELRTAEDRIHETA